MFARRNLPEVSTAAVGEDAYVLDVRDPDEWVAGHPRGAVHLPMMEIPGRMSEIPQDRDVVVVCRVGGRSAQVVAYLQAQGYERVSNLEGGLFAWQAAGRELISEDGQPARVL